MKSVSWMLLVFTTSLFLLGWSFGSDKPAESEMERTFKTELPEFINLKDFDADVLENRGTKVDPIWASRFKAVVQTRAPLYTFDRKDKNIIYVVLKNEAGTKAEIHGKVISTLYQGQWSHDFEVEGSPVRDLGTHLNGFGGKRVLVRGSSEEEAYHERIEMAKKNALQLQLMPKETSMSDKLCISLPKRTEYKLSCSGNYAQIVTRSDKPTRLNIGCGGIRNTSFSPRRVQSLPVPINGYGALIGRIDNNPEWKLMKNRFIFRGDTICLDVNISQKENEYAATNGHLDIIVEENL